MAATLEAMSREELMSAELDYEMPPVEAGDTVRFYRSGRENPHDVDIGFVKRVRGRSIVLFVPGMGMNKTHEVVRHISDPALVLRPEVAREEGAWDYAGTSELKACLRRLEARIKKIEQYLLEQESSKPKARSTAKGD